MLPDIRVTEGCGDVGGTQIGYVEPCPQRAGKLPIRQRLGIQLDRLGGMQDPASPPLALPNTWFKVKVL
jgi:hypothetical protein